jgi:hypothetical protein
MTSERCDRDVWTGSFAHECYVDHSWSNLGECVRRCVEGAGQTRPLVRESAPYQQTRKLSENNKDLVVSPRWVLYSKTDWPTDRRS